MAATYSDITFTVHATDGVMRVLFDAPGGMGAVHEGLLALRDELHEVLRETCIRVELIGDALNRTNAVHFTSDRLYQQLELRSMESSGDGAQTTITVLGAGASVIAAVATGVF